MSSFGDDLLDDEDDQENEDFVMEGEVRRDLVIFTVDAGQNMFLELETKQGDKKTYFQAVVDCIINDLKTRIISRDSDEVGICLFNTQQKSNPLSSEGVYVFKDLSKLSASYIKDVTCLVETFQKDIQSYNGSGYNSKDHPLYNALWVSQGMLGKSSTKNIGKRILLFTNNDDPFENADVITKADMKRTTIQRAKDAQDLGISIELYPMSRPGEEFNVTIFYREMIQMDDEEVASYMLGAEKRFEELVARMRKKIFQKRVVRKITVTITDGMSIGVSTYAMLRPALPGKYEWLDSSTNKPVKSERSYICADTGAIMTEPMKRFIEFNGKRVVLTKEEIALVKKVTNDPLRLLGFKLLHCLKDYHNLRPASFIYPSEEIIKGSTCVFISLHKAMLRQQKFALAFQGNSATPHLVALVAQEEIVNEYGQVQAPGMHMIYLPYADDIRPAEKLNSSANIVKATADQVDKCVAMMRKLHLKGFSVYDIQNPALQKHYSKLQAIGLQEDEIDEVEDCSLPDEEGMKKSSVVTAVKGFKDAVYGVRHDEEEAEEEAERAKGSLTAQKRKAAAEVASKEAENYDWNELAESGKLKSLTVVELKYYLVDKKLPVSGKKEVLIDRILSHMGK